ncbi:lactonase family protein [Brachybacterium hainanense]|uniref:Lactonase family protein n=1 Tax=Brachybacterium hainanense TaxID=1541174 RepID=A0ABV6RA70_9MICO
MRCLVSTWSNREGGEDLRAGLWILEAGEEMIARRLPGSPDAVFWAALDPAGDSALLLRSTEEDSALLRWDLARGEVTARVVEGAQGGCYLAVSPDGQHLAVTAPPGGWSLFRNGPIPQLQGAHAGSGSGPHWRQTRSHPHSGIFTADGRTLHAADLGTDEILGIDVLPGGGLGRARTLHRTAPGAGPRHIVPGHGVLHILCELDNTLETVRVGPDGALAHLSTSSTLPEDWAGESWAAHLSASGDGRRLYATNRGHDSIAIFDVGADGVPRRREIVPSGGTWPWFCLLLEDRWLLVANNRSDEITRFRVTGDGGLEQVDAVAVPSPSSILALP